MADRVDAPRVRRGLLVLITALLLAAPAVAGGLQAGVGQVGIRHTGGCSLTGCGGGPVVAQASPVRSAGLTRGVALDRQASTAPLRVFASAHYHIHTDLDQRDAVPYGRHMDAVHRDFSRRFRADATEAADEKPMALYLFSTQARYVAFLRSLNIAGANSGGMFFITPRAHGLATYLQGQSTAETFAVLQHEGFHQFAWRHFHARLPQWLNEGIAQVFEDAPLVDGRLVLGSTDTARLSRIQRDVRAGAALPLNTLMALTPQHWNELLSGDPEASARLYAQSWSVVYFLLNGDNGRLRAGFVRYLNLLRRLESDAGALEKAFAVRGIDPIERRWLAWIRNAQPTHLDTAEERLRFIAAAIRYFDQQRLTVPGSMESFRQELQRIGFTIRRTNGPLEETFRASDRQHFRFVAAGATDRTPKLADFQMLEPARVDLPPRVTAPGLYPEPTLVWARTPDGRLIDSIEYR